MLFVRVVVIGIFKGGGRSLVKVIGIFKEGPGGTFPSCVPYITHD